MNTENTWFGTTWNDDIEFIVNFTEEHAELYKDMLFAKDTIAYPYISVKVSDVNGKTFYEDDEMYLPRNFNYFSYSWFDFKVESLDNTLGQFNIKEQSITINKEHIHDASVILHELIHLHEFVLDEEAVFYRDAYFLSLYNDLKPKIKDLDERILQHGHLLNEEQICKVGGAHSILFLLKSYDLDLKMGYKLGTVFGYGYNE